MPSTNRHSTHPSHQLEVTTRPSRHSGSDVAGWYGVQWGNGTLRLRNCMLCCRSAYHSCRVNCFVPHGSPLCMLNVGMALRASVARMSSSMAPTM